MQCTLDNPPANVAFALSTARDLLLLDHSFFCLTGQLSSMSGQVLECKTAGNIAHHNGNYVEAIHHFSSALHIAQANGQGAPRHIAMPVYGAGTTYSQPSPV